MANQVPVVGIGATQRVGSDCYPFTVVEVVNDRKIVVQPDNATPAEGFDYYSHQVYTYSPCLEAEKITLTLRKDGRWIREKESLKSSGFYIGNRRSYQDPHR